MERTQRENDPPPGSVFQGSSPKLWLDAAASASTGVAISALTFAGISGSGQGHVFGGLVWLLALLALHARLLVKALKKQTVEWWAIALEALLAFLPLLVLGPGWAPACGLPVGTLLLAAYRRRLPALALAGLTSGPLLLVLSAVAASGDPPPDWTASWAVGRSLAWAVAGPALGLAECAWVLLAGRLATGRTELVRNALSQERRRFSRDLHDLVGHRLTVLVLKAELIQRLLDSGDRKLHDEVQEVLQLLRGMTGDVRSVAHGSPCSSLAAELDSARAVLESIEVRCQVEVSCRTLAAEATEVLAHVLREGVTNILRHARARECVIHLVEQDGVVELSMTNDGVVAAREGARDGQGLRNLRDRMAELGGHLTAGDLPEGRFRLIAHFMHKSKISS
ncbi:histidine kinase [Streptosporangium soli]|nr:histidine kinase [Streptosporangium sp. KLBMP 9127]